MIAAVYLVALLVAATVTFGSAMALVTIALSWSPRRAVKAWLLQRVLRQRFGHKYHVVVRMQDWRTK